MIWSSETVTLDEAWPPVREALEKAHSVAFDGCHKIYVLMDSTQTRITRGYGYGSDEGTELEVISEYASVDDVEELVLGWFEESCGLRFIEAVSTFPEIGKGEDTTSFPSVFDPLIRQFQVRLPEDQEDDL